MDLETHTAFLRHIGNLLVIWPTQRYEFHVNTAKNILNRVPSLIATDTTGKQAKEALLEASAHLKIAGDKIVKQQEERL